VYRTMNKQGERFSCRVMTWLGVAITSMAGWGACSPAHALDFVTLQEIELDEYMCEGRNFGASSDMDSQTLVMGWYGSIYNVVEPGRVVVFHKQDKVWGYQQTLEPVGLLPEDFYSSDVAVEGDVLVVGASHVDAGVANAGAVYVYRWDSLTEQWDEEQVLMRPSPAVDAVFGSRLDLDNGVLAVHESTAGNDHVLIYEYSGGSWQVTDTVDIAGGTSTDQFGAAIQFIGSQLIIAAPGHANTSGTTGTLFIYEMGVSGWEVVQEIHAPADVADYGRDLSTDGQRVVVTGEQNVSYPFFDVNHVDVLAFDGNAWFKEASFDGETIDTHPVYGSDAWVQDDLLLITVGDHGSTELPDLSTLAYSYNSGTQTWDFVSQQVAGVGIKRAEPGIGLLATAPIDNQIIGQIDPCEFSSPYTARLMVVTWDTSEDCDANGTPDVIEMEADRALDCDGDLILDVCQIAADPSIDCDANGIIDTCEIDSLAMDCNDNDIPDACEIAQGLLTDADGDGVPDECVAPGEAGFKYLSADRSMRAFSESNQSSTGWHELEEEVLHVITLNDLAVTNTSDTFFAGASANQTSSFTHAGMQIGMETSASASMPHDGRLGEVEASNSVQIDFQVLRNGYYALTGSIVLEQYAGQFDPAGSALDTTLVLSSDARAILIDETYDTEDDDSLAINHTVYLEKDTLYTLAIDTVTPFTVTIFGGETTLDLEFEPSPMQPCPWDVAGADAMVGVDDFFALLQHWGPCPGDPDPCPWDVTGGDDMVGVDDFFALLQHWGPCP
jgi:hypothetical protein